MNYQVRPTSRVSEVLQAFVRDNLEVVDERRTAAGHEPIDPGKPEHAKQYGFEG
jgi:hypothetical protein